MKRRRKARQAAPHEVALRLAALLPEPSALIGALAVAAHGFARATDDVDFVCLEDPKDIQARLSNAGIESAVRRGDVLKGDIRSSVYGTLDGIRFDVLFPPVPIDWEKTVLLPLAKDSRLRVVDLDGLIRLKLRAGGPQDLIDVVQLVRRHREAEPTALRVAEAYRLRDRLESWLADPRIRSPEPAAPATPRPRRQGPARTAGAAGRPGSSLSRRRQRRYRR